MIAGKAAKHFGSKQVRDVAHAAMQIGFATVARCDAGAFLTAMLQGVEAQVGEVCGFRMPVDREHATFLVELVKRVVLV
jgi:hypothetical protein